MTTSARRRTAPHLKTQSVSTDPRRCASTLRSATRGDGHLQGHPRLRPRRRHAPQTVNSFVFLARYHFFDGIAFHRIIPGFVVQGGDPTGTGTGGPGYRFADELPQPGRYEIGSLAMANAGPNTNGSASLFIICGPSRAPSFRRSTRPLWESRQRARRD